jgi:hypothetical protein
MESRGRGVLDGPLEPVVGLAEGEIRWRAMTFCVAASEAEFEMRMLRPYLRINGR